MASGRLVVLSDVYSRRITGLVLGRRLWGWHTARAIIFIDDEVVWIGPFLWNALLIVCVTGSTGRSSTSAASRRVRVSTA